MSRRLLHARLAAAIQGVVWFVLGSLGGWGLVAGTMAWLAAVGAGRFKLIARVMLLLPIFFLLVSWTPLLVSASSMPLDPFLLALTLAVLVIPGLVAVVLLGPPRTVPTPVTAVPAPPGPSSAQ